MLSNHFRALGLTEREEQVYTTLVGVRGLSASVISKRTKIARATVYGILEHLGTLGLIKSLKSRGTTSYSISGADAFIRLVEERERTVVTQQLHAQALSKQLGVILKSEKGDLPEIQVFEGRRQLENVMFEYLPEWRASMSTCADQTLWGYQDHAVVKTFEKWHRHLWNTMEAQERICLFSNMSDYHKEQERSIPGREVKPLPDGTEFSSSIWLYGDYILMGMTRERPFFAVMIREKMLAANMRAVFKLLWLAGGADGTSLKHAKAIGKRASAPKHLIHPPRK